jgi:hypothetical protein
MKPKQVLLLPIPIVRENWGVLGRMFKFAPELQEKYQIRSYSGVGFHPKLL